MNAKYLTGRERCDEKEIQLIDIIISGLDLSLIFIAYLTLMVMVLEAFLRRLDTLFAVILIL